MWSGQFVGDQHFQGKRRIYRKVFGGSHKKFGMADDTAEEGRSSQNFPSTELGCTFATNTTTTTARIKTTTKELVLTKMRIIY